MKHSDRIINHLDIEAILCFQELYPHWYFNSISIPHSPTLIEKVAFQEAAYRWAMLHHPNEFTEVLEKFGRYKREIKKIKKINKEKIFDCKKNEIKNFDWFVISYDKVEKIKSELSFMNKFKKLFF